MVKMAVLVASVLILAPLAVQAGDYTVQVTVDGMSWATNWGGKVTKAFQLKGVKDVELDFEKKVFTISVSPKYAVGPAEIFAALPKRFKATKIEISGLVAKVKEGKGGIEATAKEASRLKFVLVEGKKDGKVIEGVKKDLKALYKVVGEARIVEEKSSGRKKKVLKLFITSAEKVEKK